MIVRSVNGDLQLVLQTDHDDLSGQFAARFGGAAFWDPEPREPVVLACAEHDDGWHDWEARPEVDPESGRAWNFRDLEIRRHLAFYRAGIGRIAHRDPYAGLLVSMHGSGIYRGRYGLQNEMLMRYSPELEAEIDDFVAEQESAQEQLRQRLGADRDRVWSAYRLLQAADRFSLYFSMDRDGSAVELGAVPDARGEDVELVIEPLGEWRARLTPYPFATGQDESFTLMRRVLPDRAWESDDAFRRELFGTPVETIEIAVTAG